MSIPPARSHPNSVLASAIVDWRLGTRVEIRWGRGSALYRAIGAALIAGVILAVPATRAADWGNAASLVAGGFMLAFPIAYLVCRGLYPPGRVAVDYEGSRLQIQSAGRASEFSLSQVCSISLYSDGESAAKMALMVDMAGKPINLLHSENVPAAGGCLLADEQVAFEDAARELARSLNCRFRRTQEPPLRLGFFRVIRNNPLYVQLAALASVAVILFFLSSVPALPILGLFTVAGVVTRARLGGVAIRWVGLAAAVCGIVVLFTTVGLYAEQVETPWETPAALRWTSGFLLFFGGGLFGLGAKTKESR